MNRIVKLPKVTEEEHTAVVASLTETSAHPFSSIALSPNRQYAVISGKDTLQLVKVDSDGIKSLRTLKIAQVGRQDRDAHKQDSYKLHLSCSNLFVISTFKLPSIQPTEDHK
jgi:hypothetical protein